MLRLVVIAVLLYLAYRFTGAFLDGVEDALKTTFVWMYP